MGRELVLLGGLLDLCIVSLCAYSALEVDTVDTHVHQFCVLRAYSALEVDTHVASVLSTF